MGTIGPVDSFFFLLVLLLGLATPVPLIESFVASVVAVRSCLDVLVGSAAPAGFLREDAHDELD